MTAYNHESSFHVYNVHKVSPLYEIVIAASVLWYAGHVPHDTYSTDNSARNMQTLSR